MITVLAFFVITYYPRIIIKEKAKSLDNDLPFATLYLSTVSSAKLPLHKTFQIFAKFSGYGEITNEVNFITNDVEAFGLDINTALQRAIDRTTSKNFKEVIWGLLSTIRIGGDVSIYLKEKARSFVDEYRRKLYEFSHQLTLYIEVYLTAIILGAIFFTIMTAIMSGMGGGGGFGVGMDTITLQFLLIFIFLPLISTVFIILIKSISPSGE
jgi:flagellar protein FlaJ